MSKFVSHYMKNPVVGEVAEIDTLPLYSLICADGVVYEKHLPAVGSSESVFVELGSGVPDVYERKVSDFAEEIAEGKVLVLMVKEF